MISLPAQDSCAALQRKPAMRSKPEGLTGPRIRAEMPGMKDLIKLDTTGLTPEVTRPDPALVLSGDPVHTTWTLDERPLAAAAGATPHGAQKGMLYAGLWHTTVGEWRVVYEEWEYIRILEGLSVLVNENGEETPLPAGTSFVIQPGFKGSWRCVVPTLKDFVIVT